MTYRTVLVRLRAEADQFNREMAKAAASVRAVGKDIDKTNDRTAWLTQGLLALGPTFVPLGAAAVPVLAGIAAQATVGAAAAATMTLAFNGVGDALKAIQKAELEPTAENLAAMNEAVGKLGPDGAEFVKFLDQVGEQLTVLQMDARGGIFPGMTAGIEDMLTLLPRVRSIVTDIASGIGALSAQGGRRLAGPEFAEFFRYLDNEARPLLMDMGRTFGNFVDGFASLLVAFSPLTEDFSNGLLDMSRSFEEWAENLSSTEGFNEFLTYVDKAGPMALDFFGSLADLFVELVKAAAPVGDTLLPVLTKLVDAFAAIAGTELGQFAILGAAITSVIGRLGALRSIAGGPIFKPLTTSMNESVAATRLAARSIGGDLATIGAAYGTAGAKGAVLATSAGKIRTNLTTMAKAAGPAAGQLGLLAVSMSGVADSFGLGNTAMGALFGSAFGKRMGFLGTAIGLALDAKAANDDWAASMEGVDDAIASNNTQVMEAKLKSLQATLDDLDMDSAGEVIKGLGATIDGWLGGEGVPDADVVQGDIDAVVFAMQRLEFEAAAAERELGGYADKVRDAGLAGVEAAYGIDALVAAIQRQQTQARAATDAQFAWGQAVIDARNQVEEGTKGINEFTEAGQANYGVLAGLADAWNKQKPAIRNSASEYEKARATFLRFADELGVGKVRAEELADAWLGVPKKLATDYAINTDEAKLQRAVDAYKSLPPRVQTHIDSEGIPKTIDEVDRLVEKYKLTERDRRALITLTDNASGRIQVILDLLDRAHGYHATSTITLIRETVLKTTRVGDNTLGPNEDPLGINQLGGGADGLTVPGRRLPYGDKVLLWAAPGEEIISNRYGQADRFRADRAAGRIPGYADGGRVGDDDRINTRGRGGDGDEVRRGLKALRAELKRTTAALKREADERDSLVEKMKAVRSDVAGGLRTDLFGEIDVWSSEFGGGSPEGVSGILRGDIREARQMTAAIRTLRKKGLTGPALAEILSQGGLAGAQAFAELSRAELREFAELYNRRNRTLRKVGELAGNAAYGSMLRESRQEYRELKQEVIRLRRAVERNGRDDRRDNQENRNAQRRGAGNGRRNQRRD